MFVSTRLLKVANLTLISTVKRKNKNVFLALSEGMENCKMSVKSQGILRDDKWQP